MWCLENWLKMLHNSFNDQQEENKEMKKKKQRLRQWTAGGNIIPGDLYDLCDLAIPMWPDPAWPFCVSVWAHLMSPQPVGLLAETHTQTHTQYTHTIHTHTHTRYTSTHSLRVCSFKRLQLSYLTIWWIPITHCGCNVITVITLS